MIPFSFRSLTEKWWENSPKLNDTNSFIFQMISYNNILGQNEGNKNERPR